jgi:RNA-binding protein
MSLTNPQIKSLRAESHRLNLKPVVIIGQNGLSENVQTEIGIALAHHELIKIRIPAQDKAAKKEMINTICVRTQAKLVTAIGNVAVIFRRNEDSDRFAKLF